VEGYGGFIAVLSQFYDRNRRVSRRIAAGLFTRFADRDEEWKGEAGVVDGSQVSLFELP
jgi:hypothetical protein